MTLEAKLQGEAGEKGGQQGEDIVLDGQTAGVSAAKRGIGLSHQAVPVFREVESCSSVFTAQLKDNTRHRALDGKPAKNPDF